VIEVVPLLNILFHPSGTHANGHLDAVFVFLGPVFLTPLPEISEEAPRSGGDGAFTGGNEFPYPTSIRT
jgi:hypothetical protein